MFTRVTRFIRRHVLGLVALSLVLAACSPAAAAVLPPAVDPTSPPVDGSGGFTPIRMYPPAVLAAIAALSEATGVPTDQIYVADMEDVEWPDACLGLAGPDEMCAQVITPGYRVVLSAGDQEYEFHTDLDGSVLRQK